MFSPPPLFQNLSPDIVPVADKSRYYSRDDKDFIDKEVQRLSKEGIIEPSRSPWRAQALIVTQASGKKRMVLDYSRTINRFTLLDAYPLPKIDSMVNDISQYKYFSTLDLQSAYHQVPILDNEKIFTAFEANGKLFQFTRIPFGVTNGPASFQRVIDEVIERENLMGTYAYIDNISICGKTRADHDNNLRRFEEVASKYNFTFNHSKSILCVTTLNLLGYLVKQGEIRPDPDRLKALLELPIPTNTKSLQRVLGFFAYYSQWIPNHAEKSVPLNKVLKEKHFKMTQEAINAFNILKKCVENSVKATIDEEQTFIVETDSSEHSIAATLNQGGQPVAFFSRTLSPHELKYPSVEKEAYAIVEALKKWRHFLLGRKFVLITDQRSVSFMFNSEARGKVKNEKITRWRIELACFKFDIRYRKGSENHGPDLLSRSYNCAMQSDSVLYKLHENLCHPGVTRLLHFVRSRNLPYSAVEIKRVVGSCVICAKLKPQFTRLDTVPLIKATQPFERLSLDFKGPLPSTTRNKFLLTIVDEYSRFPFAYPCSDISTKTVIGCLNNLFSLFGMPSYIHSDRGGSFMSSEFKEYLTSKGIASSRTSPYNPQGNGQIEKYNGTIWKAVQLAASSKNIDICNWEILLPDALHSIRSLLCTSTNTTPHERLFSFQRRSTTGGSLPSWLLESDKVLIKRFVRNSKNDPLVDEVDLIQANPNYAIVKYPNGRESTVSLRHISPLPKSEESEENYEGDALIDEIVDPNPIRNELPSTNIKQEQAPITPDVEMGSGLRRSTRTSKPPDRLTYYK